MRLQLWYSLKAIKPGKGGRSHGAKDENRHKRDLSSDAQRGSFPKDVLPLWMKKGGKKAHGEKKGKKEEKESCGLNPVRRGKAVVEMDDKMPGGGELEGEDATVAGGLPLTGRASPNTSS